jgi:hypothetical protein
MIRREIATVLNDLPLMCAVENPSDGTTVLVRRGIVGYWEAGNINRHEFNKRHNVTPAQEQAMSYGSVFGFDVPAADPLNH